MMEYVLFVFMMIVPVIAVAAFIIALLNAKRIKTLKRLTADAISRSQISKDAIQEIMMESI